MNAVYTYRSNWRGYIGRRVLYYVLAFFLISFFVFSVTHINFPAYLKEISVPNFTGNFNDFIADMGFDRPLVIQYWHWIGGILTGDWGHSIIPFYL